MSKKEMTTEKRLKVRLYLSLLVYTVVGYGLTLILDYIFSKFDNGIFAWLYWRLDLLFILYLMLGFICIFNYYWKKPWGYLDEVIDATQTVYEQNNHTVSLSEPLKELEEQLNQIKMSVLLSKQAAKQAEEKKNEIVETLNKQVEELQRISGLSQEEAKQQLLSELEKQLIAEKAAILREAQTKAKEEATKNAKEILGYAIQKCAADHTSETTVSIVALPNEEMKGRIIGREGRNIKTLETLTGIDLIIDETPEAEVISGFDPLRREVAK